jgi:hypothetical protein
MKATIWGYCAPQKLVRSMGVCFPEAGRQPAGQHASRLEARLIGQF